MTQTKGYKKQGTNKKTPPSPSSSTEQNTQDTSCFCFWYEKRKAMAMGISIANKNKSTRNYDDNNDGNEQSDYDPVAFLDKLKQQFPELHIQAVPILFILSKQHLQKIVALSVNSEHTGNMLAQKIEADLLMRFAMTDQINQAIKKAGIQSHNIQEGFAVIAITKQKNKTTKSSTTGKNSKKTIRNGNGEILKLQKHLQKFHKVNLASDKDKKKKEKKLKELFGITAKQLNCTISDTPLEDILAEKAACLLR